MTRLPRCDLKTSSAVLRSNDWGQGYRITETSPAYDSTPGSIHAIIDWLDVERGRRWAPKPGTTYCNVYATDLAHACGVFLPRVWWTPSAETQLTSGAAVTPIYGSTVVELSANALFRWLSGPHSATFGWQRTDSLTTAQDAANGGLPVVLCCRKKVETSPGHIAVVAPEISNLKSQRDPLGNVITPVISQAGAKNVKLGVSTVWWSTPDMAEWGVWIHDPACV